MVNTEPEDLFLGHGIDFLVEGMHEYIQSP